MNENHLGIILLVAVVGLFGRIVWDWLKGRKITEPCMECQKLVKNMAAQTTWLKEMHDKVDTDGMPLWYVPRGWKDDLEKLHVVMIETNVYLKQILETLKSNGNK